MVHEAVIYFKGNILVYHEPRKKQVSVNDIERVVAELNYSVICLYSGRRIVVSRTLKCFEHLVVAFGFVRVHRKEMIDSRLIKNVDEFGNVYNQTGQKISVFSRRKLQTYSSSEGFSK